MGIKISAMTPDSNITGVELIAMSDAGASKSATITNLKAFVIDQIEAIVAGSSVTGSDSIFILQSGVLKPVDIDIVAQHAIDTVWGKAAETSPDGADVLPLLDGATEKTLTLTKLWDFINALVLGIKIDDLTAGDDNTDLDASSSKHGLMPKADYIKLATIEASADVTDATNVEAAGALMDADLLDEDDMASDSASKPASQQSVKAYVDGLTDTVEISAINLDGGTDIGEAIVDADLMLVDNGAAGINRKTAVSRLWTYIWDKIAGSSFVTPVVGDNIFLQDASSSYALKKTSMPNLAVFIQDKIKPEILDVSDLAAIVTPGTSDKFLVTVGTTGKYIEFSDLSDAVYDALDTYVGALAAVSPLVDTDVIYVIRGGVEKKSTIADIGSVLGNVIGPATTTVGNVPIWGASTLNVTDGLDVRTDVRADGSADNDSMATERGIRDAIEDMKAEIIPEAVDGTLVTGDNNNFEPTKLVYNKTCSDSDGDDVIDLHDCTVLGQIVTVYLGTKSGTDSAVITPVTALYTDITLGTVNEVATLQWQGATVGWAILYTNGVIDG